MFYQILWSVNYDANPLDTSKVEFPPSNQIPFLALSKHRPHMSATKCVASNLLACISISSSLFFIRFDILDAFSYCCLDITTSTPRHGHMYLEQDTCTTLLETCVNLGGMATNLFDRLTDFIDIIRKGKKQESTCFHRCFFYHKSAFEGTVLVDDSLTFHTLLRNDLVML